MQHNLTLYANSMAIAYSQEYKYVYTNTFSFDKQNILPDYGTHGVV